MWEWHASPEAIARRLIDEEVKRFAACAWHGIYGQHVPVGETGRLRGSVRFLSEGDAGIVEHNVPYAARQYGAKARAKWDEAAKAAGGAAALAAAIEAHLKGR